MSIRRFADLEDAGRQLSVALVEAYGGRDDVLVLGVEPFGVVVAGPVAEALGAPMVGVDPDGPAPGGVSGRAVLVVDDGVEGGGTASRLAALVRLGAPARLVLAVPVCPREPYAALSRVYDEVVALERPLMVRSLAWHYEMFPGNEVQGREGPQVP